MATQFINGTTIHFADKGTGRPLVLLHSFPADLRVWNDQIGELSSRRRVIAPDFRGFGQSPPGGPFTVASLAQDVRELLRSLDALPCVLAGISMGGYTAMNFARQFPADLSGLILVDTKDAADNAEQRENRDRMIEVARSKGSAAIADLMIGKLLSADTAAHRPAQVKTLRKIIEACPALTIEHALAALRDRPDMTGELPKIATPTLIVVGDADEITPIEMATGMHKRIAGSQLAIIPGAGHMSPMEQPSLVNRALRQFLDGMAQ
ncbi:MAG TPA: alpha/beta fold hydrolase [Tepidisphaeraceae bacterium]|jgi:pimeloyl-ACP methyl ester carboxylesterase|nr:alpha/beta fold hydrolase [Tepidisphaeraceae bacterium]